MVFQKLVDQNILKFDQNTASQMSLSEKTEILKKYAHATWNLYTNENILRKLRDQSLDRQMDLRGAPKLNHLSGRARFEAISRRNLNRLMEEHHLTENSENTRIENLVQKLEFSYHRNGRTSKIIGPGVLSSRQLRRFGTQGENSQHKFSKEFLINDDNIYFHFGVLLGKPHNSSNQTSEYGNHGLTINKISLLNDGVVSPYIMWHHDMIDFAQKYLPELNSISKDAVDGKFSPYDYAVRKNLHKFDFTANDFRTLLQSQLRKVLTQDSSLLLELELNPSHQRTNDIIRKYIFEPLSLPDWLEMKIPVFLPKEDVNRQW